MERKVTYIDHSGFCVETEDTVLLFDYCKGQIPVWDRKKKIAVFASHSHGDHFQTNIFSLADSYPDIHFFLGKDIRLGRNFLEKKGFSPEKIKFCSTRFSGRKEMEWEGIRVFTFTSTDAGVAFLVEVNGELYYHAGDLHWWHWRGEPEEDNHAMELAFKEETAALKELLEKRYPGKALTAAFFPLDPRQEEAYCYGMNYFLEQIPLQKIFPMHMWGNYEWIDRYLETENGRRYQDKIQKITKSGQSFLM